MDIAGANVAVNAISWDAADTSFPFVADYSLTASEIAEAVSDGEIDRAALKRLLMRRLETDYGKGVRNIAFKYETLWKNNLTGQGFSV
jgi:hypothetical protein